MANKKGTFVLFVLFIFAATFMTATKAHAQGSVSGERVSGSDRYETSLKISKAGWPDVLNSGTAIIATGNDFPDALSAAPLASKYNAPILLTDSQTLDSTLSLELTRLKVNSVFIIGGPGAVSSEIEEKLKLKGIKCTRLFGNDRYETSAAVANEIGTTNKVVVATGENFPDALSIASWAASNKVPILLTEPDKLPPGIEVYIKKNAIEKSFVIGGTGVVGDSVLSKLVNPERIYGNDRFETNVAVLNKFNNEFDFKKMYLATGNDFPDALAGSALAALTKSPIILTDIGPLPMTKAYIDSNISRINEVYILGGEGVVSDKAVEGVIPPVVSKVEITLSKPNVAMNKQIRAIANITMIPSNAAKPAAQFTVSDSGIASISHDGTITGQKIGNARVTAIVGGKTSSINLLVRIDKLIVLDPGHGGTTSGAVPTLENGTKLYDYKESVLNMQVSEKVRRKLLALGTDVVMTRTGDVYVSLEDRANMANDPNADLFVSIHHNASSNLSAVGTEAYYSSSKPGAVNGKKYIYATLDGPVYDMDGRLIGDVKAKTKYNYIDTIKDEKGNIYYRMDYNGTAAKVMVNADYITLRDDSITTVVSNSMDITERISRCISDLGLVNRGAKDGDLAVTRLTNMTSVLVEVGFISNTPEFRKVSQDSFQEMVADKIVQAIVGFYESNQKR